MRPQGADDGVEHGLSLGRVSPRLRLEADGSQVGVPGHECDAGAAEVDGVSAQVDPLHDQGIRAACVSGYRKMHGLIPSELMGGYAVMGCMETRHFKTPAEFRAWLAEHHATASELGVVLYTKASGEPTMTWSEAVDQALCFGWIDSVARRLDETRRVQRFTPRKPKSNWSAVNIKKVAELTAQGLMEPAGLAAFARRKEARSGVYSYENRHLAALDPAREAAFRANARAWEFFSEQPPSYPQTSIYLVMNAKREETRSSRLARLISVSGAGGRLA